MNVESERRGSMKTKEKEIKNFSEIIEGRTYRRGL